MLLLQLAGILFRWNIFNIQHWLVMPRWIARACDITLGRLLVSSSPVDGPMGATLELQRQEQMERLEQQMLLQRSRDARRPNIGQGYAERLVAPEAFWGDHLVNGARRQRVNAFNPMSNALSLFSYSFFMIKLLFLQ